MWTALLIVIAFGAGYAAAVRYNDRVVDAVRDRLAK